MWRSKNTPVVNLQKVLFCSGLWVFGFCLNCGHVRDWRYEVLKLEVHGLLKAWSIKSSSTEKLNVDEQRPDQMRCYQRRAKDTCLNTFPWKRRMEELKQQEERERKGYKSLSTTEDKARQVEPGRHWCMRTQGVSFTSAALQHPPCTVPYAEQALCKCVSAVWKLKTVALMLLW